MSIAKKVEPFACGGTAACIASTVVHPIDLAKVRLQLYASSPASINKPSPGFLGVLSTMIKNEGIASIYAGISAAWMRQLVYGTARIGLHRTFSDMLSERNNGKPLSFLMKTVSGMASGSIAVVFGTPFDVALVRMQADSMKPHDQRRGYKGVFDALARVAKEEGIGKLYSGLTPNILRGMSMNVGMLACYDQAKEIVDQYITHDLDPKKPSMPTQLGAALISGFTAAAFSLPFDLLKSRMQDGSKYKGIIDAAYQTLTKEGVFAFWTGFSAYYSRCAPHSMIILLSIERITQGYRSVFQ